MLDKQHEQIKAKNEKEKENVYNNSK